MKKIKLFFQEHKKLLFGAGVVTLVGGGVILHLNNKLREKESTIESLESRVSNLEGENKILEETARRLGKKNDALVYRVGKMSSSQMFNNGE